MVLTTPSVHFDRDVHVIFDMTVQLSPGRVIVRRPYSNAA